MNQNNASEFGTAAVRGTVWSYISVYAGKSMVFLSTIILARLLDQTDFGVVGYALIVTSFLDALSGLGIGPALIYHPDEPETPDTAFWLGLVVGLALFGLIWVSAPLVGGYFRDDRAISVVRAMALVYPISAFGNVNSTYLVKELDFKRKFIPEISYAFSKGLISVLLAFFGFGYWSQVWGQVGANMVMVLVSRIVYPWSPTLRFSKPIAQSMLKYGLNIVALDSLANLLNNADYLLIGRHLGVAALGIYTLGFRIPDLTITQFARIVSEVIFPVYVKMKDESKMLAQSFAKSLQYVSLITVPMGIGIALMAEPIVLAFFTDKWIEAIPVIRAIAVYAMLLSLFRNAGSFYKAQGRPEILTYLTIIRLIVLFPALWFVVQKYQSIEAIAWVQAAVASFSGVISLIVASRVFKINLGFILEQFVPAIICSTGMGIVVWAVLKWTAAWNSFLQIALAVIFGVVSYSVFLWALDPKRFKELLGFLSHALRKAR